MHSGEKLQGTIQNESIIVATALGKLIVPVTAITEIETPGPEWPTGAIRERLVLHYPFETEDGQTAINRAGPNPAGSDFAGRLQDGFFGLGRSFNGENQYVRIANPAVLNSKAFTIALWCRLADSTPNDVPRGLFGKRREGSEANSFWLHLQGQTLNLQMAGPSWSNNRLGASAGALFRAPAGGNTSAPASAIRNQWGFVAVAFDGSRVRLYVNGESVGQIDVNNYAGNDLDFLIGAGSYDSNRQNPRHFWRGDIDEVTIFDNALAAEDIERLFASARLRETVALLPLSSTPAVASTNPVPVVLDLLDGSHLKGEVKPVALKIDTTLLGTLKVPMDLLQSMIFADDGTRVAVVLRNRDVLIGMPEFESFDLAMIFGRVKTDRSLIRTLTVGSESAATADILDLQGAAPRPPPPVSEPEMDLLAATLKTGGEAEREAAVRKLVGIGPAAIPILRRHLSDADSSARWWLEAAIQQIEDQHGRTSR